MPDNPKVTSKFDRMHGKPRTPGKVESPGGTATPGGGHGTTHGHTAREHNSVSYHPSEHGRMDRGERAEHPTHGRKEHG